MYPRVEYLQYQNTTLCNYHITALVQLLFLLISF